MTLCVDPLLERTITKKIICSVYRHRLVCFLAFVIMRLYLSNTYIIVAAVNRYGQNIVVLSESSH